MSPCDGRILNFGPVDSRGFVEQVKGVTYPLKTFFGQNVLPPHLVRSCSTFPSSQEADTTKQQGSAATRLYHCVLYLAPGDYHGFHSPADWSVAVRRHFPGERLNVIFQDKFEVSPRLLLLLPRSIKVNRQPDLYLVCLYVCVIK